MNLELGWWLESPSEPPVPASHRAGVTGVLAALFLSCFVFYFLVCSSVGLNSGLMLVQQAPYLLSYLISTD